jgi:hypothetical protein
MDTHPGLARLAEAFAAAAQLGRASPDADGFYHFVFDDSLTVRLCAAPGSPSVLASAMLDAPPPGARDAVLRELLAASWDSDECLWAVEPGSGRIVLTALRPLRGMDESAFAEWLATFVEYGQSVKATLEEMSQRRDDPSEAAPDGAIRV